MCRQAVLAVMAATTLISGCTLGNAETVEDKRMVGDKQHVYRTYYDKDHNVVKRETYENGELIDTWTP